MKMASWSILDKNEHCEEYQPIVCSDRYSNFSIAVNAVLTKNNAFDKLRVRSCIRLPFICLYFEDTIIIFTAAKCEIKLFKIFECNIKNLIIQKQWDTLIVILENNKLFTINIDTGAECCTDMIMKETFSLAAMIEQDDESLLLVSSDSIFCSLYLLKLNFDRNNKNIELSVSVSPIKYNTVSEKSLFLLELYNKNMLRLHGSTLCIKLSPNKNIHSICPITNQSYIINQSLEIQELKSFENSTKLLILHLLDKTRNTLCITDFYNMDQQFSVDVTDNCTLIGGVNDFALYTDVKDGKLYVFMVQENSPLSQLEILISLRDYEGAESFARTHKLSPTAVLELKAKYVLNNLKKCYSAEGVKELYDILSSCDNIEFLVNCSCEGVESNIKLSKLLEYSKMKLLNTNNFRLNHKVDTLLWKVDAFKLLEAESEQCLMDWQDFVNKNPINLCKKFIINDLLDCAAIVWLKSYRFVSGTLKLENVGDLLCSISLDTKLNSLLRWLEYFIPSVISIMPHSADTIVTWAKDRICILENSVHWPEVGIQFAEKFSNLMFHSKSLIAFVPPSAEKVFYLINCMTQIQTLKKDYNIIISLRDFTTLCSNELTKLILRKSFTEDLELLLSKFVDEFITRQGLNHDNLISEYIEELLGSSPTIDESKLNVLINSIFNVDEKYRCIIQILKSAQVPWSGIIKKIVADAISEQHFLVPKIHIEMIHSDIRTIKMKYKCQDLSSEDYEYLIRIIINNGDSEMMSDIEKITNVYWTLKEDAYLLCIQKYVERGEVQKALYLFDNMEINFKNTCIYTFVMILENQLSSRYVDRELESNYLDFFKSSFIVEKQTLKYLNSIYVLKNRFNLIISYSEYCVEDYRKYFFICWCKNKSDKLNRSSDNMRTMVLQSVQVGEYLMLSKVDSVTLLANHSNDKVLQVMGDILTLDRSILLNKDIKIVDLILKLSPTLNFANITCLETVLTYLLDILEECDSKHMSYCIDVCSWLVSIYYAHNNTREMISLSKTPSFYNPHVVTSIIPIWKEIFSRNSPLNFKTKEVSVCLCDGEKQCIDGSSCLPPLLDNCQTQQNDIYFVRIMAYCTNRYFKNDLAIPQWFKDLNDNMIKVLASKMIMLEKPDHLLISVLLFSYSSVSQWLNDCLTNYTNPTRKINISQHILKCREMHQHIKVPYSKAFMTNSQNNIDIKLESYGISLQNFHQDDRYNVATFLESLAHSNICSIEIIEEFCKVANLDLNQILTCYLFSMLKSWNDDYQFVDNSFGKCKITACNKKYKIMQNCVKVLDKITSKTELVNNLTMLFKNGEVNIPNVATIAINLYCYEAYLFILDLLKNITGMQLFLREFMLLKFLQSYQRISKPKQSELDEFSMKETFPKIGFYRLPFQSLMSNCWNNLKPEITLISYKQWLPVACLLPVDVDPQSKRDMICSNAVKQSMTKEKDSNDNSSIKWTLHLKNDRLLKEAHECVQHISNLEWAGACFYHIFLGSSFGADQVAAADMCYQFAEHWVKIEPNNNAVRKMKMKHLLTSSAHILHKIGLAEDRLLALCDNPHRLIEAMYNHKIIITRYEFSDVNNAVDEIAEKHNLNAPTVRMSILERILNVNNVQTSDTSVNLHNKSISASDGTLNRESLMRACYILKGTNQTMAALYLSHIGLGGLGESIENYNTKIKALQCLLSLISSDIIERVTNQKVSDLWLKLWELYFVNGLNLIGLEYLISVFYEDKSQVIDLIWHAREHNQLTVSLLVKMLFIYNLQVSDELLDDIIKDVLRFDLMFEVKNFLNSVKFIYGPNYINMWKHILLTPFKRLDTPLIGHQKEECYESLKLLPMCPVLPHIDLTPICHNCLRLGIVDMAVLVLPHMPRADRKSIINKIGKIKKSTLQELKIVKSKGFITMDMVMSILKHELTK